MTIASLSLANLIFTAIILCGAMTLSWLYFGRKRYALLWAIAAGGSAVHWTLNAIANALAPEMQWIMILSRSLIVINCTLIAMGGRERAGLPMRLPFFVLAAIAAILTLVLLWTAYPNVALRGFVANAYCAIMIILAAGALFPRDRIVSIPEIMVFLVLMAFSLLCVALALLSLGLGPTGTGAGAETFRAVLIIGVPAGYAAVGISFIFLMATDLNEQLKTLITRDPLTGILNRRGFAHAAASALANAKRRERPIAIIVCDIDGFRAFNARHGYPLGDRALAGIADLISTNIREDDVFARVDGNVFIVALVDSTAADANDVVRRVHRDLALFSLDGAQGLGLIASFGVAESRADDINIANIALRADEALQRGRLARQKRGLDR